MTDQANGKTYVENPLPEDDRGDEDERTKFIPSSGPLASTASATVVSIPTNNPKEIFDMDNGPPLSPKVIVPDLPIPPQQEPPDGGLQAWSVMAASFFTNGILFGTINSSGLIFSKLKEELVKNNVENPSSKASFCLSLLIGMTFMMSVVSGVLTDKIGIRKTTFIGGAIATLGMFLSSIVYNRIELMTLTYGLMVGVGGSLAYTPSLVILGHYFRKRMGLVNGFVTSGSSLFTILMPMLFEYLLEIYDLSVLFQVLAALMSTLMFFAFIFKPRLPPVISSNSNGIDTNTSLKSRIKHSMSMILNISIWRNMKYVIWAVCIPLSLFGYFVPYVHLIDFTKSVLGQDANAKMLVMAIGLTSGIGRVLFGFIADKPWVDRILLQQISFFCIGTFTMLLTAWSNLYFFLVLALGMGLFDGCFISLLGPIAFDIVGPAGAPQAIGNLLALCSIPLTFGPVFAGLIEDSMNSYFVAFLVAGIPPILGSFALFTIRCIPPTNSGDPGSPMHDSTGPQNNEAPAPKLRAVPIENGGVGEAFDEIRNEDFSRLNTSSV